MPITKNAAVSFRYRILDRAGTLLTESDSPVTYIHGGYGFLPGFMEELLEGRGCGERIEAYLSADEAYGPWEPELVVSVSRLHLPEDLEPGTLLEAELPQLEQRAFYKVRRVDPHHVVLDGNHPFAGMDIRFEAEITQIRPATSEELSLLECQAA